MPWEVAACWCSGSQPGIRPAVAVFCAPAAAVASRRAGGGREQPLGQATLNATPRSIT
jgi:hypothetical protein